MRGESRVTRCELRVTGDRERFFVICYNQKRSRGQVAQLVERSPEKAGVGGSTPSLATILFLDLASI